MANLERRLERLEQEMQPDTDQNAIVVYVFPGEDEATKLADAYRKHGLDENHSRLMIVVKYGHPDQDGGERPSARLAPDIDRTPLWARTEPMSVDHG